MIIKSKIEVDRYLDTKLISGEIETSSGDMKEKVAQQLIIIIWGDQIPEVDVASPHIYFMLASDPSQQNIINIPIAVAKLIDYLGIFESQHDLDDVMNFLCSHLKQWIIYDLTRSFKQNAWDASEILLTTLHEF